MLRQAESGSRLRDADSLHTRRIAWRMIAMEQINETETTDQIVQETRRIKEALAKSMNFDIDRILEDARQKQKQSGRKVLPPPIRQKA